MPYNVTRTDSNNNQPITVFDNTSNTDTSLVFPGRNVTGYGQIIAENFLHLLENFSNSTAPVNPIEGQLWYDNVNGNLNIWDNTAWKAASGIQKGPTEPAVAESKVGELWVDTTNQQLRIFTGARWLLVGPAESSIDGLRYGPVVESIVDSDNNTRYVLTFYLKDVPVMIVSKDSFTPKTTIAGFLSIKSGININDPANAAEEAQFEGGLLPKLYAIATAADSLIVNDVSVAAGKFLRSDIANTTEFGFRISSNSGLTLGIDGNFEISSTSAAAKIYNKTIGSSVDIRTNRNGVETTVLRVVDNKVGINKVVPDQPLDVEGNAAISGQLIITNTSASTNLNNGSIKTLGGVSITKNLLVGTGAEIIGTTVTNDVQPKTTDTYESGTTTSRWKTVRAKTIIADTIEGVLNGNISGNANTANNLKNVTTFQLAGDVISPTVQFDGQIGSYTKIFNTTLTSNIIDSKDEVLGLSKKNDYVLTYRPGSGLLKQQRDVFVGDLGVPIGTILPYAGPATSNDDCPTGYLLCDGSEVQRSMYPDLYDTIGNSYNGVAALVGTGTFRLPDLRGRFPLGRDNMDGGGTVPKATGGYVDGGGGNADRVPDTVADQLGGSAGQSSVTLTTTNLPQHEHKLERASVPYNTVVVGSGTNLANSTTGTGTVSIDSTKLANFTGGVNTAGAVGTAVGVMNPYLTINYIIRSGPPTF